MTEAEGAPVAELIRMVDYMMDLDRDPNVSRIKLDKFERQALVDARSGVIHMVQRQRQRANDKIALVDRWMMVIADRNIQLKLLDEKGRALETPRERTCLERIDDGEFDGIDAADGEQITIEAEASADVEIESQEHEQAEYSNGVTVKWGVTPGVPPGVESGLIQALRDGCGRTKACELVAKETALTKTETDLHFDALVRKGLITKEGRNWVTTLPEEHPTEATIG